MNPIGLVADIEAGPKSISGELPAATNDKNSHPVFEEPKKTARLGVRDCQ